MDFKMHSNKEQGTIEEIVTNITKTACSSKQTQSIQMPTSDPDK